MEAVWASAVVARRRVAARSVIAPKLRFENMKVSPPLKLLSRDRRDLEPGAGRHSRRNQTVTVSFSWELGRRPSFAWVGHSRQVIPAFTRSTETPSRIPATARECCGKRKPHCGRDCGR